MKRLLFLLLVAPLLFSQCKTSKLSGPCYKGKLVRKAMCMNYTISVMSGNIDTALVVAHWQDPNTGDVFTNAFSLGSPCTFPSNINEGDEFYFNIDNGQVQNCAVCLAYYPTPEKHLSIKVSNVSCN